MPSSFTTLHPQKLDLVATTIPSPLGWMATCWQEELLQELTFGHPNEQNALDHLKRPKASEPSFVSAHHSLTPAQQKLIERLQRFAEGEMVNFSDVPLALDELTNFAQRVTKHCRQIALGQVVSYAELARRVGSPRAARAIGNVMASNRWPLVVPCHRVISSAGGLGGYSAFQGVTMKQRLLEREGVHLAN